MLAPWHSFIDSFKSIMIMAFSSPALFRFQVMPFLFGKSLTQHCQRACLPKDSLYKEYKQDMSSSHSPYSIATWYLSWSTPLSWPQYPHSWRQFVKVQCGANSGKYTQIGDCWCPLSIPLTAAGSRRCLIFWEWSCLLAGSSTAANWRWFTSSSSDVPICYWVWRLLENRILMFHWVIDKNIGGESITILREQSRYQNRARYRRMESAIDGDIGHRYTSIAFSNT